MVALLDAQRLFDLYKFQNSLPIPEIIDGTNGRDITLQIRQISQFLGLYDSDGDPLSTTVWGYGTGIGNTSYPGPTILAYEGVPITVHWQNNLPLTGHLLPVDTSLHFADSTSHPLSDGFVPIVTHLHGGHNDSIYDGLPDQWFTQGGNGQRDVGPEFVTSTVTYGNDQEAATLWYHDHALGITRLNVYAGLAGFYVLGDQNRLELVNQHVLPSGNYDLGMAIQDRAFTSDGQLYYPAFKDDPLPGTDMTVGDVVPQKFYDTFGENAPSVVPEFFGDTILVNGMAWPKLDVAAGDYEFRLLDGSDSRFYVLEVSNPNVAVHLVGTDGGLLPKAVTISDGDGIQESNEFLVLAPGDRVELVFDFSKLHDGDTVNLLNVGPKFDPFGGISADGSLLGGTESAGANDPVGNIMQFAVNTSIKPFDATVQDGTVLVKNFVSLTQDANHDDVADLATNVRKVGLFEGVDAYDRVTPMLGKAEAGTVITDKMSAGDFGPLLWDAPTTEKPLLGSTEQWDMFNFTADSHPMHLHLTQYQVLGKWHIDFLDQTDDGIPDDTNGDGLITYGKGSSPNYSVADIWIGDKIDLRPEETGLQDTAWVDPHEMMAIVATFDKPGDYVWHCHILSHEDNEMMRPYTVVDDSNPITGTAGTDSLTGSAGSDTIQGLLGDDTILSGDGPDLIYGNQGMDVIYGNLGQDTGYGGQGDDTVCGGQGNDLVYGNLGNDVVYGNFGDDFVFGGQGADRLFGGQGNDTINGNLGNDTLFGNLGADRFVFGQGAGADVVMDFTAAQGDRLDVQGQTHVISTAADGWALITLSGGGTIEMVGLTPPEISDSFFV